MGERNRARGTFWIGAGLGAALALPLCALAVYATLLALHADDPRAELGRIARLAGMFAGLPAFLTGGGIGRLVARRLLERTAEGAKPSLRYALALGAGAMAAAGMGLAVLVAIPHGGIPGTWHAWVVIPLGGLPAGGLAGLALGWLVGQRVRKRLEVPA